MRVRDALGRTGGARRETQARRRVLIEPAPLHGVTAFLRKVIVSPRGER